VTFSWLIALAILATQAGFWCCCGPCGTHCVTVRCGTAGGPAVAGALVELQSGGVTVSSGYTDSLGTVCLDVPSAGTYTRVVTASLFAGVSTSVVLACGSSSITIALAPIGGYSCFRDCCDDQVGPPYPDVTWPTTLYIDDGFGGVTLTSSSGSSPGPWYGSANRTAANAITCNNDGTTTAVTNASVPIYFMVTCAGDSRLRAHVGYFGCRPGVGSSCQGDAFDPAGFLPTLATNPDVVNCNANNAGYAGLGCSSTHQGATDGAGHKGFGRCSDSAPIHCPPSGISVSGSISGTYSTLTLEDYMWYQYSQIYGSTGAGTTKTVTITWSLTS